MNKKILLIGDAGYIGSRLYSYLNSKTIDGCEVHGYDLNLWGKTPEYHLGWRQADYGKIDGYDLIGYDVIILLAGNSSPGMSKDLQDTYDQNVHKFMNLVKYIKGYNPGVKFIYASSASVCEKEDAEEVMPMPTPKNPYDATKQIIDKLMACSDLDYYGLRFGTVAGASPNMRWELLVNSMFYDAKTKGEITVSNPRNWRAILALDDLCRAVKTIIESSSFPGFYNLASFEATIGGSADIVKTYFKQERSSPIKINKVSGDSTYSFSVDTSKFEKTFGFKFTSQWYDVLDELDSLNLPENKMYHSRSTRYR